jgi:hypothetical protein
MDGWGNLLGLLLKLWQTNHLSHALWIIHRDSAVGMGKEEVHFLIIFNTLFVCGTASAQGRG